MAYKDDIKAIYAEELPWEGLSGSNILVVGATGLIGSCLVEALMLNPSKDYKVFAGGRNEARARKVFEAFWNDASFSFIKVDVTEKFSFDKQFDYIIDAASNASPNFFANNPVEVIKANVFGVANMIDYGRSHGMKRFLYVSTGEVYGQGDGRVFTEDYSGFVDSALPRSCYPSSKRAAETLCVSYAAEYGVDVVIARPCHVYGPRFTESDNRAYAQFIRNVRKGEDIVMKSDGSQFRSWCYVVDCVKALLYILMKGENAQAYNVADPESNISIRQFAETIASIGGKKVVFDLPSDMEKKGFNPVTQSVYDVTKLISLGWKVPSDIISKLRSTIEHEL